MGDLAPDFNGGQPVWIPPDSSGNYAALRGVAGQRDGKLVAVGLIATQGSRGFGLDRPVTWVIERFLPDGRLDPAFGSGGVVKLQMNPRTYPSAVVVQPADQRILIGGDAGPPGSRGVQFARLNTDGSLDIRFGGSGLVFLSRPGASVENAGTMALDASGNAYLAGWAFDGNDRHRGVIASVTPSGAASGWAPNGILLPDTTSAGSHSEFTSVAVSGRTVFYAGSVTEENAAGQALIGGVGRSDGAPAAFGTGGLFRLGPATSFSGLVLGSDGKLKATGSAVASGPAAGTLIASFETRGADPADGDFGSRGTVLVGGDEMNSPNGGKAITEQKGKLFVTSPAIVPDPSQGSTVQPALVGVDGATGFRDTRLGPGGFRVYSFSGGGGAPDAQAGAIAPAGRFVALAGSGGFQGLLAVVETVPRPGLLRARRYQRRLRGGRMRVRVVGRLRLPPGVSKSEGCRGSIAARFVRRGRLLKRRRTSVTPRCRYSVAATFAPGRAPTRVALFFAGNDSVGEASARAKKR